MYVTVCLDPMLVLVQLLLVCVKEELDLKALLSKKPNQQKNLISSLISPGSLENSHLRHFTFWWVFFLLTMLGILETHQN